MLGVTYDIDNIQPEGKVSCSIAKALKNVIQVNKVCYVVMTQSVRKTVAVCGKRRPPGPGQVSSIKLPQNFKMYLKSKM